MTTIDTSKETGLSRSRLLWLRNGRHVKWKTKNGEIHEKFYPPVLIEGEDWYIDRLKIVYTAAGIEKIRSLTRRDK